MIKLRIRKFLLSCTYLAIISGILFFAGFKLGYAEVTNSATRDTKSPLFTPLEKATEEVGGGKDLDADGGLMPPSAETVSPVRNKISNGVRENSLTGFAIGYYMDAKCTDTLNAAYLKEGAYFTKITIAAADQSSFFPLKPFLLADFQLEWIAFISIDAEGAANDVALKFLTPFDKSHTLYGWAISPISINTNGIINNMALELLSPFKASCTDYLYKRTISRDKAAIGEIPEAITIISIDVAANKIISRGVKGGKYIDMVPPEGGSISYLNGETTSKKIKISLNEGSDRNGIGSRTLERASADYIDQTPGVFSPFSTIALIKPGVRAYEDNLDLLAGGKAYKYRYIVTDKAGNSAVYESKNIVKETAPVVVDGDKVEYFAESNEVVAEGNVIVTYADARMTCEKIVVNTQTKDLIATGNVRLQDPQGILETDKLVYNFETKKGNIIPGKLRSSPYYYFGDTAQRESESLYTVKDGFFSSCNYDQPHFRVQSKRVEVYPNDKVIARSNVLYWYNVPFFYLPRYTHDLKDPFWKVQFKAGKTSDWGLYLLSIWRHDINENVRLKLYLDWREEWEFAEGFGINYNTVNYGKGDFKVYYTKERRWHDDQAFHQEFQRYFGRLRHQWDINDNTQLTAQYYRIEDGRRGWHSTNFLRDYFYEEYEKDSMPESYVLTSYTQPYWNLNMIVQKRTNRWYSTAEKLPEITFNFSDHQIGESPFYFENNSTLASLNNKYATPSPLDDDVVKFDTYNQLTMPIRFMFIEFSPYSGIRETYFSKDDAGETLTPRTTFYSGIDMSTKVYRVFNLVTNFWGLNIDKLRHVIAPEVKFKYIHEPTVSPLRVAKFGDGINGDNRVSVALENKLQTKRDGNITDIASLRVSSDYIMYSKSSGFSKGQDRFTDFLFELSLVPFAWLRMSADATYNHRNDYFSSVSFDNTLTFGSVSLGLGHRYSRGESKEMTTELNWRINPKWQLRVYERYEFGSFGSHRRGLREQEYTVIRDLHCATIELTFNRKKKYEAKTDVSFWCIFNLRIFRESEFDYAHQEYHPPLEDTL
ncbi:MAG: OstA-like protein [Candidatus Omnitrophota bacterium]